MVDEPNFKELSEGKIKQLMEMPIIESKTLKSENGDYIIHKTVITDIKPRKYYEKVISD